MRNFGRRKGGGVAARDVGACDKFYAAVLWL